MKRTPLKQLCIIMLLCTFISACTTKTHDQNSNETIADAAPPTTCTSVVMPSCTTCNANDPCFSNRAMCDDPICEDKAVCCHQISPTDFEAMVLKCSTHMPDPYVVPADIIWSALDANNCRYTNLSLVAKTACNTHPVNDDIVLMTETILHTASALNKDTEVDYSMVLFRGIRRLYPATTEFHFYKAKRCVEQGGVMTEKDDIVFKAVNASTVPEEILYYGDLSDLFP